MTQARLSFGETFGVSFAVGLSFDGLMLILGVVLAFVMPTGFNLNNAPAHSTGEALVALLIMGVIAAFLTAIVAAIGSLAWMVFRLVLPRKSATG